MKTKTMGLTFDGRLVRTRQGEKSGPPRTAAKKTAIKDNPLALRMATVIRRTWNYVGEEFSELCGGECSRPEMMEAVFDACRYCLPETSGGDEEAEAEIEKILDEHAWGSAGIEELFSLAFPID